VQTASEGSGGSGAGFAGYLVKTAFFPGKHFPHVHAGRPVTNLFRVLIYVGLGENPAAYQTVLLLLLVLLAALLAELAGYLSRRPVGGALCALLFVSCPPVAGLLAWTSHLNLVLGLVLATAGLRLTIAGILDSKWWTGIVLGFPFLCAALLTRETELFVIPLVLAAVARTAGPLREVRCWRRIGPLLFYLVLALFLWAIPSFRARSGGVTLTDFPLTLELARVTYLVQAGTVLKSLAWFLLLPLGLFRFSTREDGFTVTGGRVGLAALAVSALVLLLLSGGAVHVVLLSTILVLALLTADRTTMIGLAWAAGAGIPILVYGAFAGRYTVEPLFGLCLAMSPLLGGAWEGLFRRRGGAHPVRSGPRRAVGSVILVLVVLQFAFNVWPDAVFTAVGKPGLLRRSAHWGEVLVWAMKQRADAFTTFIGRVPGGWQQVGGWRHSPKAEAETDTAQETLFLWHDPDGRYIRLGTYYSPMEPDLPIWALTAAGGPSWEWNRWFWRSAQIKGPGRLVPRLGGLKTLSDPGVGSGVTGVPPLARLWAGDEWDYRRLVAAVPELSDAEAGLTLFNHYRQVAEALGADERQAMVLFETLRLFCIEDGRCDAYEKHLLDRIAIGWAVED
jgi:hypothetical protein